jgi:fructoselysine-6-P-deglycase FrlB-like protein
MNKNKKILPNLSESLLQALKFFKNEKLNNFKPNNFKFPLIVGSGNAINTGKLIFGNQTALFATESDLNNVLKNYKNLFIKKIIKEAIVISASGEKDSVWELKALKKLSLKTTLFTCSPNSSASRIADKIIVFNKLPEPYTYNISTYLAMILTSTKEKAIDIENFIKKIKLIENFSNYTAYTFIIPDKFSDLSKMLEIKRDEFTFSGSCSGKKK